MRATPAPRSARDDMAQQRQARHLVQHFGQDDFILVPAPQPV